MSSNDTSNEQSANGDGPGPGTAVQRRYSGELATRQPPT
jgi:hypothetical protein